MAVSRLTKQWNMIAYYRTKKIWKTVVGVIGAYTIFFVYGAAPSFIGSLSYLPMNPLSVDSDMIIMKLLWPRTIFADYYTGARIEELFSIEMALFFLPFVAVQVVAFFYLWDKKKFIEFFKKFRYLRLAFHYGALAGGLYLGNALLGEPFDFSLYGVLALTALFIAATAIWTYSLTLNDIYDMDIDKISNPDRPLVSGIFTREEYRNIGIIAGTIAIFAGFSVGYNYMVMIVAALLLSYIYSAPPFRLKRFPIMAPFLMSLGTAVLIFTGYRLFAISGTFYDFPINILFLIIIVATLVINAKDIKDYEGDRKFHVHTIPTMFGEKRGKLIISLLYIISYLVVPIILLQRQLIITAVLFGVLSYFAINAKKTNEILVAAIYTAFLIVVASTVI
ncbi:UbiA prenyltransferase family protein [Patescibacteria group bacterium]